ncbi:MAG TPA: PEP-CTERM sorting domain-containing protein [Fimbriimonadaceae bacterium]|nr:PEP-CTERM sorting domain-containing protein [Fimbriimonadaceae bacterium]
MKLLRIGALVAVFGAVIGSAGAFSIDVISVGTVVFGANAVYNENVIFQTTGTPMPDFTTDTYSIVNNPPPDPGSGLFDDGAGDTMSVTLVLNNVSGNANGVSGDGIWNYTGGTGAYAGLTGAGTFAFNIDTSSSVSNSSFIGDLEPVPEPASMIALGLGIAGFVAKRRRR